MMLIHYFIEITAKKGFWTGGNDIEVEGVWRWKSGELIRFGAPLWGSIDKK